MNVVAQIKFPPIFADQKFIKANFTCRTKPGIRIVIKVEKLLSTQNLKTILNF